MYGLYAIRTRNARQEAKESYPLHNSPTYAQGALDAYSNAIKLLEELHHADVLPRLREARVFHEEVLSRKDK